MDNEQIKNTIEHFNKDGKSIRVRDIAYTLLSKMFVDGSIAYQCLFGQDGYDDYANDEIREQIEQYMTDMGYIRSLSTDADTGGLTFEENKKEMESLLEKTQIELTKGTIEPKDALKIMADIRVKLNDKFKVESQKRDRMIIVEKKYNHICEKYHCECYLPTKEDLIEMYDLVEKQKIESN